MLFRAIDHIDYSDDSAKRKFAWNLHAIFLFHLSQAFLTAITLVRAGVNQKRTTMIRAPRSILDVFVTIYYEPRPRLP
jgi:hypothetical protein